MLRSENLRLIILATLALALGLLVVMTDRLPEGRPSGQNRGLYLSPLSPAFQMSPVSPLSPVLLPASRE